MTPKELSAYLKALKKKLKPTKSEFKAYADIVNLERKEGFDRSEDPEGNAWAPLAESTVKRKRKRGSKNPSKPLIDKGHLRNAMAGATETYGYVRLAFDRSERVHASGSISDFHDLGLGVPRRKHWGIYKRAAERVRKLYLAYVKEVLRAN